MNAYYLSTDIVMPVYVVWSCPVYLVLNNVMSTNANIVIHILFEHNLKYNLTYSTECLFATESIHQSISDSIVFHGSTLYLYNDNYPDAVQLEGSNTCTCTCQRLVGQRSQ